MVIRAKERISIVLDKIDMNLFLSSGDLNKKQIVEGVRYFEKNKDKLQKSWEQYPDQRLGQFLINNSIINDDFTLYNIEETKWLIDKELVEPRQMLFWGQIYDKDGNKLPEVRYSPIMDLNTEHIEKILETQHHISKLYKNAFEEELQLRKAWEETNY